MLNWSDLPAWATVLKRVLTIIILAVAGLHAYVQYRRHGQKMLTPERWMFFAFSLVFLFGTIVNFVAIILTTEHNIKQGPFGFGLFSLLIAIVYLIFAYRAGRRTIL